MTWFKVDDSFYRSKKVRKLGRDRVPCVGLWTLCGDWSADNLTDGFVPWEIVEDWDEEHRWAERLIEAGLWSKDSDDGETGVRFHDWHEWQPTRSQVMAERRYNARKSALYRDPELVEVVRQRDRDRCRYCGAKVNWKDRRSAVGGTYDHVDANGLNTVDNLVVACRSCNSRKGDRSANEAGMPLLEPGAMGPATSSGRGSNQQGSSSYLDTDQVGSRTFQDPVPTRPVLKETPPPSLAPLAETDEFAEFWAAYPRRVEKRAAEKAWRAALKRKASPEQIIAAAKGYAERTRDTEPRFVKHPASWLSAGAYEDEQPGASVKAALRSFEEYRTAAAATEAGRLLGIACILREQPPSDETPRAEWLHRARVEWIDRHESEIRTALTERKTG